MHFISCLAILGLSLLGIVATASAGDLSYVPPGAQIDSENDAMSYFASGQHKREEMALQKELREKGTGVPQSQLYDLPDAISISGKGELKVKNGQLVTNLYKEDGMENSEANDMPTTLDGQLEQKAAQIAPASGSKNMEHTAIIDKQRGAKTNIISNTDTGVVLSD
ncbi:MAG: hypothetical protein ACLFR0_09225 [Alphaproteobacteria bacterium]